MGPVFVSPELKSLGRNFFLDLTFCLQSWNCQVVERNSSRTPHSVQLIPKDNYLLWDEPLGQDDLYVLFDHSEQAFDFFEQGKVMNRPIINLTLDDWKAPLEFVLKKYFQKKEFIKKTKLLDQGQKNWKELLDSAKNYIQIKILTTNEWSGAFIKLLRDIFEFHQSLILKEQGESLPFLLNFLNSKIELGVLSLEPQDSLKSIPIPLVDLEGEISFCYLSLAEKSLSLRPKDSFLICYGFHIMEGHFKLLRSFRTTHVKNDILLKAFDFLSYPVALFSSGDDLLFYNRAFINLKVSLKQCLELEDSKTIEVKGNKFRCSRIEIKNDHGQFFLFVFSGFQGEGGEGKDLSINPEELGIITSSIAHELNNPLAGILVAIALLKQEDGWTEAQFKEIEEMESSARRCKSLIEVFLGVFKFQRSPVFTMLPRESFTLAMNLLRFRIVETNIKLQINWEDKDHGEPSFSVNPSILSMVFYLLFSELITRFSHQVMIKGQQGELALSGRLQVKDNGFLIVFGQDIFFQKEVQQWGLVHHLLKLLRGKLLTSCCSVEIQFS